MDNSPYKISYNFKGDGDFDYQYTVNLDPTTSLLQINDVSESESDWTALEFNQCSHCPLKTEKNCPVALGLSSFLGDFTHSLSYKEVTVTVVTEERTYLKETQLQSGIYSIMGLIMATSGCPKMNPLKSMARFHLPFSTLEETLIRVLSFYLVHQYFETKKDPTKPSFDLTRLESNYKEINLVNQGILARIKAISERDANKNGLVVLQAFSSMLSMAISQDFEDIEAFFRT